MIPIFDRVRVTFERCLSTVLALMLFVSVANAHEVMPSIADFERDGDRVNWTIELNLEGILAGVDLSTVSDTNDAPEAESYDSLNALPAAVLADQFRANWDAVARAITIGIDGVEVAPVLTDVSVPERDDIEEARRSEISFYVPVENGASVIQFGWIQRYGDIVIRQQGVDAPFTSELSGGELSDPISLGGGDARSAFENFLFYIPVGFEHIIPLGLDHILFVLGLFFLSTRLGPLLWQISAFTLAHTITLALAALGIVVVPGSIVEPLIAASIVFVAVENIFARGLTPWRPVVVFLFGLLHGLGFASVLGDYGLPSDGFIAALIGFNIGVELGQLSVIAVAYLLVGYWFGNKAWYRRVIAIPASLAIAAVGVWWVIERVFL